VVLVIIGVVVVLLLLALPVAKRREQRKGRRSSNLSDVRSAIRAGKEHKNDVQLRDRPKPSSL
jgi:type II secretory pathway pseudopilin PulG